MSTTTSPTVILKDRITELGTSLTEIDARVASLQIERDSATLGSKTQGLATDLLKLYKAHQLFGRGVLHLLEAGSAANPTDGSISAAQSTVLVSTMKDEVVSSEPFGKFVRRYAAREAELATDDGFTRGLRARGVVKEETPGLLDIDHPELAVSVLSAILDETLANFRTFIAVSTAS